MGPRRKKQLVKELVSLQAELVKMQETVRRTAAASSSCSRAATRPARAGSSSASSNR